MPELTKPEQEALMSAMTNSFGGCSCARVGDHTAFCDGHRFLFETQVWGGELRDRVQILAYYRRFASFWTSAEFSRPFVSLAPEPMLEVTPLPESITRQPDTDKLPW